MAADDSDAQTPVSLIKQDATGDLVLIYADERGVSVELRYEGDGLWMTQAQIARLFGRDVSVISRHIANILEEGELEELSNLQFMQVARSTKPVSLYSLDMVISVGYRASSSQATLFRRWATGVLVRFATKGFVVDAERLKNPVEHDRVRELREIVRDIRASEANLYAELRRICALCQDYDPKSDAAHTFYREMQAKLFYAVTNLTPAEILSQRADANQENMGLQAWPKVNIRKSDALVSKNYLAEREITELNRLTSLLLDIFEDQLDIGRLVTMADAQAQLDGSLAHMGRLVLQDGGHVRRERAEAKAAREYERFDEVRRVARKDAAERELSQLKQAERALPKTGRRSPKS
jgi:hypothetical protein